VEVGRDSDASENIELFKRLNSLICRAMDACRGGTGGDAEAAKGFYDADRGDGGGLESLRGGFKRSVGNKQKLGKARGLPALIAARRQSPVKHHGDDGRGRMGIIAKEGRKFFNCGLEQSIKGEEKMRRYRKKSSEEIR